MAVFNKFDGFKTQLAAGTHAAAINANTDALKVYLTAAAVLDSTTAQKANIAEINMTNEATHGAGGASVNNSTGIVAGVITVVGDDVTFTASGGTVGPFQYVVLYNSTQAGDHCIGYWEDAAGPITLQDGETYTVNFGPSLFTID